MTNAESEIAHPAIVLRDDWLVARKTLLGHEKDQLKHYDRVNAERRRLPMVKIDKHYVFDGPNGKRSLGDLFDGRRQLIVYHFMFDPAWETHRCPGCTGWVDALGDLSLPREARHDVRDGCVEQAPGVRRLNSRRSTDVLRDGRAFWPRSERNPRCPSPLATTSRSRQVSNRMGPWPATRQAIRFGSSVGIEPA